MGILPKTINPRSPVPMSEAPILAPQGLFYIPGMVRPTGTRLGGPRGGVRHYARCTNLLYCGAAITQTGDTNGEGKSDGVDQSIRPSI